MTITQIDAARQGIITDAMKRVAEKERKTPEEILRTRCGRYDRDSSEYQS